MEIKSLSKSSGVMTYARADQVAPFIQEDDPGTLAYHLLNRRAYHAALGGDLTEPGSGKKTVVHLLAGLTDATLRPDATLRTEHAPQARRCSNRNTHTHTHTCRCRNPSYIRGQV